MTFIRAPYVSDVHDGTRVLASVEDGSLAYSTTISWPFLFIRNWMKTPGSMKDFWKSSVIPEAEIPG